MKGGAQFEILYDHSDRDEDGSMGCASYTGTFEVNEEQEKEEIHFHQLALKSQSHYRAAVQQ